MLHWTISVDTTLAMLYNATNDEGPTITALRQLFDCSQTFHVR